MDFESAAKLVASVAGALTAVVAVLKYLSRRDTQIAAQKAFRAVVDSLSSEVEGQRLGAAILLRRFFDKSTELGEGKTPYAREAINVIAALLRGTPTGNFQKLLADGLQYAESLEAVDLQRTNLQNAYLGRKGDEAPSPNLRRADFYRADLSAASFKGADLSNAVFYQARLHNTIFKEANLAKASFFEADLLGANFAGATLAGAQFGGARNIPAGLRTLIADDGAYHGPDECPKSVRTHTPARPLIFISKPGTLNVGQQELLRQVTSVLEEESVGVATVERRDYPAVGAISEVRRVLSGCSGVLVLGFRQLEVGKALWRSGTGEAAEMQDVALPTTWNHVEAGMAAMAGLPALFLIERRVIGGLFELGDVGHVVADIDVSSPDHELIRNAISGWCHSVREHAP
jgi:uncharacterized protein YjbI with pentapeptide repeats